MDTKLSEQIQAMIDALELAQTQVVLVTQTMRKQRLTFGLDYKPITTRMTRSLSSPARCAF